MTIGLTTFDKFAKDVKGASAYLRIDSIGGQTAADTYRIRENAAKFQALYGKVSAMGRGNARLDALGTGAGLHLARQLEHVYAEVLKDQYAPNNGLDMFAVDRSVPAGARTHTLRRLKHNGEAHFYDGAASRRSAAGVEQREESFNVAPIVTSIHIDFFDQLAADFSGFALRAELENAARDVMDRFISNLVFQGAPERKLPGVLTIPWVPKATSPVTLGSSTPEAVLLDLHAKAHYGRSRSKGLFRSTRLLTSLRGENYLKTTKRSATTEDTIASAFVRDSGITEIIGLHELEGTGPGGTDIMIFDAPSRDAFVRVMPQDFTMLPANDSDSFSLEIPCYAIYGGMISREPLHNLISYVATSGI